MTATYVFLFCLFLTYAAYLLVTRKSDAKRARMRQRLAEALEEEADDGAPEIKLSRDDVMSESAALSRLLARLQFTRRLKLMIAQADLQITVSRLITFCLLAALAALLAAYTLTSSLLVVAASAAAASAIPVMHVAWTRKRRLSKFLEHLPDTLDLMSRSLAVGHAFSETLSLVATEMPEPVATEFRITFEEQKLGLSTKVALEHLAERVPILDLQLCVTGILIQRETGGNLAEILAKIAGTIRERFKMEEDLKTLTANGRYSAWILSALPLAVAFVLTALNPDYMSLLWRDPRGHSLLLLAAVMQLSGMLVIRRIMRVKL